jgi:diguanylate cyclase (GGDEF)-like protein
MTIGSKCQAWLRASLRTATFAGLILIAACWLITAYVSSFEREQAIEGMVKQSDAMVRLFEEYTVEIVERTDRTLRLLRKSYEDDPDHFDLRSWAARSELVDEETLQVALIGADGYQLASTTDYQGPPLFLGDRAHFRTHLDLASDKLFISEPVLGRATGRASLEFTRRIRARDGGFGGVMVISVNPNFIARFFRAIDLGQHGSIILRNLDGVILCTRGLSSGAIGQPVQQQSFLQALARADSDSYWGDRTFDGYNRLVTYRTSEKFPLVFAVGVAENDGLGGYLKHRTQYLVLATLITFISLIAIAFNIRHQAKLDQSQDRGRRLNDEILEQNLRFDAALANMSNGLSMFDADGRLMVWNDRYVEIHGMPPELIRTGISITTILEHHKAAGNLERDVDAYIGEFRQALLDKGHSASISRRRDGRVNSVVNTAIAGGGWVAIHEDITARFNHEAEIAHMARHDALTGLANRAAFNAKLAEVSQRVQRHDGTSNVLLIDLDKFKAINDTLGHPAGDQLLVEVGRRLQSTLRETDMLARLGGDEFGVIQDGGSHPRDGAITLAQRIIQLLAEPFDLGGHPAHIGSSVGIAIAPEHGLDPEQLITAADLALYDVKAGGRNDFRVFQADMLELARTRKSAESELRDALARNEFELHYQPVVDVKAHLLCGVEALVRWRHPTKGLIAPDHFIPLAESTGLIAPLGEWVLQQACVDAASLPEHIKVAVNVSAVQFRKGDLFNTVSRILAMTGVSPERIELEITETTHLEHQDMHLVTMRKLKNLGISMVLDDFGTGYSSISHLTSFPFDKIKIDKSFTQGALDRSDCAAVVASTLTLAKGLRIVTTAEGVETEQQFEHMRNLGVDLVQGYIFGRPVPISEFGPQMAMALEVLCRVSKPRDGASLQKRAGTKLLAS